jgi:hypothetical protein
VLQLLKDLHGHVVEFKFIDNIESIVFLNLELDFKFLSKCPSSWSLELEGGNVMRLSTAGGKRSIILDLHRDREAEDLEWNDIKVDWYDDFFEHFSRFTGEEASEAASWLELLLCVVHKLDLGEDNLTWSTNQDFIGN